ncbi:MAG: hypothetical protein GPJ54_01995 [Candidatus Heimdallarchaeota archaeon]|nr:hypothetical protein [Candidatus Heimdallarchaeota archaeon]
MRDDLQPEKTMDPDGESFDEDYTVLRSTDKQMTGIKQASRLLAEKLDIDKNVIQGVLIDVFIDMQIQESRYHYQTENDLPQFKIALKKIMEPRLKSKLSALLPTDNLSCDLDFVLDRLFHWYMEEYLPSNNITEI